MDSSVDAKNPGGLADGLADGFDEQAGRRGGDATRHLRAAAHFDRLFRGAAIAELVENRHRIPAPSPGVDSALVLEECLTARRWAVTAACFDLAIGLIALLISVWVVVFAVIVVVLLALVLVLIRGITSSFRSNRDSATATLARAGMAMGMGAVVLAIVVFLVINHLESDGAATGSGLDLTPLILGTVLVIALWAAVGAVHLYQRQRRLVALLVLPGGPEHLPGAGFPQLKEVFKRLHAREAEAETVYGGFNAFVGAGLEEREEKWSFAVELRPSARYAAENRAPEPLETPDLQT